jgi:hypothetical protein
MRALVVANVVASVVGGLLFGCGGSSPPPWPHEPRTIDPVSRAPSALPDRPSASPEAGMRSGSPGAPPPGAAVTYRDPDDAFDVTFPSPPHVSQEDEPLAGSTGELRTTFLTWSTDSRLLMVGRLRLLRVDQYDCERGLAAMRDSSLRHMGCTSTAERPTTLAGLPAREVEFQCQKRPFRGLLRVACDASGVVARREALAYSVMYMERSSVWSEGDARTFVDGFHLHPRP